MYEYEKKMNAILEIASTLNPIPLRELAHELEVMAIKKEKITSLEDLLEELMGHYCWITD